MKKYSDTLTYKELAEVLCYDPITGVFTHKVSGHRRQAGAVCGRKDSRGYVRIRVLGKEPKAHRLAWLFTHKVWPKAEIDHINGCPSDNRIVNLRDVSVAKNGWNRNKAMRNNKTGLLGVCLYGKKFKAQIQANKKHIVLGTFATAEEAHRSYMEAKLKLHDIS